MRFFIFPLENIYIAVAADKVKRFISSDAADNFHENNKDTDQIIIPVNMIFGKLRYAETESVRHGIVLKHETNGSKTLMIITPPVERDIEVAEKDIQSLPGSFTGIYSSFNGIFFYEPAARELSRQLKERNGVSSGPDKKIVFFLDVEKFTSLWLKRSVHDLSARSQAKEQAS